MRSALQARQNLGYNQIEGAMARKALPRLPGRKVDRARNIK
jgi:hypothetical protein